MSYIVQTMISVRSNSLSLKYQGFKSSECKDIWIRKFKVGVEWSVHLHYFLLSFREGSRDIVSTDVNK